MQKVTVDIGTALRPFLDLALPRLRYLFPECDFATTDGGEAVVAQFDDESADPRSLAKEINYALYREKIFSDTLSIRKKILGAGGKTNE